MNAMLETQLMSRRWVDVDGWLPWAMPSLGQSFRNQCEAALRSRDPFLYVRDELKTGFMANSRFMFQLLVGAIYA